MSTIKAILRSKLAGPAFVLAVLIGIDVFAGVRGAGFGSHWDEIYEIKGLEHGVETLSFLPEGYYYGGLYFDMGYLGLSPEMLRAAPRIIEEIRESPSRPFNPAAHRSIVDAQRSLLSLISSDRFLIRLRDLFTCVSALCILWTFLLALNATGSGWIATAAAGAVALSWEFSYHSRWIAVDAMLAQFAALTLLFVVLALRAESEDRERRYLRLAAAAAGLGIGSKASGFLLLVPIFAAVFQSARFRGWIRRTKRVAEALAIAAAVFVVTTPGAVLQPLHFIDDVSRAEFEYQIAPLDFTYSAPGPAVQLGRIMAYLAAVLFSHYPPIAIPIFCLCVLGAVVGIRSRRKDGLVATIYLLTYVAFVAMYRLLIVRNLLPALPAFALLGAIGLQHCAGLISRWKFGRSALAALCVAMAAANAGWILYAANSVRTTTRGTITADLLRFLSWRPGEKLFISPPVMAALVADHKDEVAARKLSSASWAEADYVVIFAIQHDFFQWVANVPWYAEAYFTSWEVNYDYYPTWWGKQKNNRIVVLSKRRATRMRVTPQEVAQEATSGLK